MTQRILCAIRPPLRLLAHLTPGGGFQPTADPTPQAMMISDANITDWETKAHLLAEQKLARAALTLRPTGRLLVR